MRVGHSGGSQGQPDLTEPILEQPGIYILSEIKQNKAETQQIWNINKWINKWIHAGHSVHTHGHAHARTCTVDQSRSHIDSYMSFCETSVSVMWWVCSSKWTLDWIINYISHDGNQSLKPKAVIPRCWQGCPHILFASVSPVSLILLYSWIRLTLLMLLRGPATLTI